MFQIWDLFQILEYLLRYEINLERELRRECTIHFCPIHISDGQRGGGFYAVSALQHSDQDPSYQVRWRIFHLGMTSALKRWHFREFRIWDFQIKDAQVWIT